MAKKRMYKQYYENDTDLPRTTQYLLQKSYVGNESDSSTDDMEEFSKLFPNCDNTFEKGNIDYEINRDDHCHSEEVGNHFSSSISYASNVNSETLQHDSTCINESTSSIDDIDDFESNVPIHIGLQETDLSDFDYFENSISDNDSYDGLDLGEDSEILNKGPFIALQDQLETSEFDEVLSDVNLKVSKSEMLLEILKLSSHYSLSNSVLEDVCKMFNTFLTRQVLPETRYAINKLFTADNTGNEYHAFCPKCNVYLRQFQRKDRSVYCEICQSNIAVKGSNANFFVVSKVHDDVKHLIEDNAQYYSNIINERHEDRDVQRDIYDGLQYKKIRQAIPLEDRHSYATCTFNSDGSPVFKSSAYSIWPIQIIINELPYDIRHNKPVTWALWVGRNKPKMNIFLKLFVDKMHDLSLNGVPCDIDDQTKIIKLFAICCCVDSVARAPMQGIVQYNGYYGCSWCLHPGVPVTQETRKTIKYPLLDYIPDLRTELQMIEHMEESINAVGPVYGVKGPSVLVNLKHFNIITSFVPDSMHCISLGICRQFAHYWFKTARRPYSISSDNVVTIDKILCSLQIPKQLARLPRPLKDMKYWKAREWENWLLYYSLPILQSIPNFESYAEHWQLLVEAVHILMGNTITTDELIEADQMLKSFVSLTEVYYSDKAMTYNVHQLLHLAESVKNWGPLWAHSGYSFESGNGRILRMIKAAKGILHQICRSLDFQRSILILKHHIDAVKEESPAIKFYTYLENKNNILSALKISDCTYLGKPKVTNKKWIDQLQLSEDNTVSFLRMVKDNCLFHSSNIRILRSCSCYAQTVDEWFIEIQEFIVDSYNNKEYIICKIITTEEPFLHCKKIKKVIMINSTLSVIELKSLSRIAVCINVNGERFLSGVPNMLHY